MRLHRMEEVNKVKGPLHHNESSLYKDAFAPPALRVAKAWERAPFAARASRFHGHKIWKKAGSHGHRNRENHDAAQLELEKEGTGARKKLRVTGTKQNVNDALWQEGLPLVPGAGKVIDAAGPAKDDFRSPLKEKGSNSLACIPRKRTNADHIITPRKSSWNISKSKRSPSGTGQEPSKIIETSPPDSIKDIPVNDLSFAHSSSPEKPVRRRKSLQRSTRRSLHINGAVVEPQRIPPATQCANETDTMPAATSQMSEKSPESITTLLSFDPSGLTNAELCDEQLQQESEFSASSEKNGAVAENSETFPDATTSTADEEAPNDDQGSCPLDQQHGEEALDEAKPDPATPRRSNQNFATANVGAPTASYRHIELAVAALKTLEKPGTLPGMMILVGTPKTNLRGRSPRRGSRRSTRTPRSKGQSLQSCSAEPIPRLSPNDEICVTNFIVAEDTVAQGPLFDAPSKSVPVFDRPEHSWVHEKTAAVSVAEPVDENLDSRTSTSIKETQENLLETDLTKAELHNVEPFGKIKGIQDSSSTNKPQELEQNGFNHISDETLSSADSDCEIMVQRVVDAAVADEPLLDLLGNTIQQESKLTISDATGPTHISSLLEPPLELGCTMEAGKTSLYTQDASNPLSTGNEETMVSQTNDSVGRAADFTLSSSPVVSEEVLSQCAAPARYDHDDTDMLRNFLTRVKANKAAKAEEAQPKKKRSLPHSPLRLPLAEADSLPSPTDDEPKDEFDISLPTGSPRKRRKVNVTEAAEDHSTELRSIRRSGRTRLPVKAPLAAPSFIPIRRLGQDEDTTVTLKRNEEKELAALTRVNTRKNKNGAMGVAQFLARKMEELEREREKENEGKPSGVRLAVKQAFEIKVMHKDKDRRDAKGRPRKNVVWAEALVEYQSADGKLEEVEKDAVVGKEKEKEREKAAEDKKGSAAVKVGMRKKVLGIGVNGTPAPKMRMRGIS